MRLRFIGLNGSMGLHFGQIYRLTIHPWKNGVRVTSPVICPYDSEESFWHNWAHPNEELRSVMEAKGRALRKIHIRHEGENTPIPDELPLWRCTRSEVHGSHNWQTLSTEKPYAWCPGKTDKEQDEVLVNLASGLSDGAQGEDRAD